MPICSNDDFHMNALQPQISQISQVPARPQLENFSSSAYEEQFSDVVSTFDNPSTLGQPDADTTSIDRDNKLLSFSLPAYDHALLDYSYRRTTISLSAQLHGMFFLAESPWTTAADAPPPPSELTCYRRNLFQITGEIALPRALRYVVTEQGEQIPILGQELVLSAVESTEGGPVKIISVPWKTPANANAPVSEEKIEREPPPIPLDTINMQDGETEFVTVPYQWKRLQFRIATANNGRRKELQQHFVMRLKVLATLAIGTKVTICEIQSAPVVVRGRSPRNFQARKDLPLGGNGHARRSSQLPAQLNRNSSNDSANSVAGVKRSYDAPTSAPLIKAEPQDQMFMPPYLDTTMAPQQADFDFEWSSISPAHAGAMTTMPPAGSSFHGSGVFAMSSPELTRSASLMHSRSVPAPISLSLVEEDVKPSLNNNKTPADQRPTKRIQIPPRPPSFSLNTINTADESADLLYEYFPLSMDDWMPPIDAVYRPHVVHHIKLPSDPRDPKVNDKHARSKRYFSEAVT